MDNQEKPPRLVFEPYSSAESTPPKIENAPNPERETLAKEGRKTVQFVESLDIKETADGSKVAYPITGSEYDHSITPRTQLPNGKWARKGGRAERSYYESQATNPAPATEGYRPMSFDEIDQELEKSANELEEMVKRTQPKPTPPPEQITPQPEQRIGQSPKPQETTFRQPSPRPTPQGAPKQPSPKPNLDRNTVEGLYNIIRAADPDKIKRQRKAEKKQQKAEKQQQKAEEKTAKRKEEAKAAAAKLREEAATVHRGSANYRDIYHKPEPETVHRGSANYREVYRMPEPDIVHRGSANYHEGHRTAVPEKEPVGHDAPTLYKARQGRRLARFFSSFKQAVNNFRTKSYSADRNYEEPVRRRFVDVKDSPAPTPNDINNYGGEAYFEQNIGVRQVSKEVPLPADYHYQHYFEHNATPTFETPGNTPKEENKNANMEPNPIPDYQEGPDAFDFYTVGFGDNGSL